MARFWRGAGVITTQIIAGATRLILAAMAALPAIQQLAQGLETRVANGVAGFLSSNDGAASGQNVPSPAASSSANSAAPTSTSALSTSVTSALLKLQDDSGSSQVRGHHHHGAGKYKAASDLMDQLTGASGQSGSTGAAASATTTVTA